ncbi:VWA domain-containing protein [Tenacibaculum sp. IB213877]|uniref:VWA domain-containing protein n=1 Tax=Tenacibaculum sp. IB213877 TaxID=3097351 RepID=UPI002A5A108B|nr:VWA domain-containing protein [Tenacibaculum sp. IB213877]MDY0779419.1 VWA domain-containing protein [Tenacibaculum sp. IB213877]
MQATTLLYIILAVLFSVFVGFFQYFYKVKNAPKINILLFILRTLSVFLLLLLLINPKIKNTRTENTKPVLSVLVDNSLSAQFFKEEAQIKQLVEEFKRNFKLNDKFDVNFFSFGKNIQVLDSLHFDEGQTNIAKAIQSVNDLYKNQLSATVLISDGNQTIGNDYEFTNSKQAVFPLVIGDTAQYQDIKISQLNVNKYSYIKNKFPVEALVVYDGKEAVSSVFTITKDGKKVFSKRVSLSPENNSTTVSANLTSDAEGLHYYSASISRLENEKNTKNNYKNFSVEVIDEQTKVLVLASVLHPDLGAFKKAIESNQQRQVEIVQINKFEGNLNDYQLVIFYQPNSYFRNDFQQRTSNFLLVTGTKTDWNFVNSLNLGIKKSAINQSENYRATYNAQFLTFLQKDIGFGSFPPLRDKFGSVSFDENQPLAYQRIGNISTEEPLISTFEKGESKFAVILGEDIWKWRAASYLKENSFQEFDEFLGNFVQYLASNKKRNRLEVNFDNLYLANQPIQLSALYLDQNYQFDNRASLQISILNSETKERKIYPFSLVNNAYQVNVEGLPAGDYSYKVTVEGQTINKSGRFKISDYQIEEQFTRANTQKLEKLANNSGGKRFYKTEQQQLINVLVNDKNYYTTQKSIDKEENLINWKWILFLIAGLLTIEWFTRKYFGKI